jgi:glycosyltransferase involved in cell wall biosynthesis
LKLTLAVSANNSAGIIRPTFESIRAQSVQPDEVFLVVDRPEDNTIPVGEEYGVKILISEKGKLYHARNTALAHCRTEILAFTDDDCVLDPDWVRTAKEILETKPEVAAGTGPHPPIGDRNFVSWLHHMWFVVETKKTGYTDGVIGGNSYFRTQTLRDLGGWLPARLLAAEDVYISRRILESGGKIWFDDRSIANHKYKSNLRSFLRTAAMMGHDITVMMRLSGMGGVLWWYTLTIPIMGLVFILGLVLGTIDAMGFAASLMVLFLSLSYLIVSFRSLRKALPRWAARWFFLWPYGYGILKGLLADLNKFNR